MSTQYRKVWQRSVSLITYTVIIIYILQLVVQLSRFIPLLQNPIIVTPLYIVQLMLGVLFLLAFYDFRSIQAKQDYPALHDMIASIYLWIGAVISIMLDWDIVAFCLQFTSIFSLIVGCNLLRNSSTFPDAAGAGAQKLWIGSLLSMVTWCVALLPLDLVGDIASCVMTLSVIFFVYRGWHEIYLAPKK